MSEPLRSRRHAPITRVAVEARGARDPLAGCHAWFTLPPGVIYLDGHRLWNGESERRRRLQVDEELELRELLDGQVARLGTFEDRVFVAAGGRGDSVGRT